MVYYVYITLCTGIFVYYVPTHTNTISMRTCNHRCITSFIYGPIEEGTTLSYPISSALSQT